MNKFFARLTAGALAALTVFALAACGEKKGEDDKSASAETPAPITEAPVATDEPTAEPTEEPTPPPEPTATPIPEGWYIDPRGIIPPEVEIVVRDGIEAENEAWCITEKEGRALLQLWTRAGLKQEWELPDIALTGYEVMFGCNYSRPKDVFGGVWLSDDYGEQLFFYQDEDGRTLAFRTKTQIYADDDELLIGTVDGKAIRYHWGNDYYEMHDFGTGAIVETVLPPGFGVNGFIVPMNEISFINIYF